jgi:hypothetical protein
VSELVGLVNWKNISGVGLLDGSEPLGSKLEWTWAPSGGGATDELAKTEVFFENFRLGVMTMGSAFSHANCVRFFGLSVFFFISI